MKNKTILLVLSALLAAPAMANHVTLPVSQHEGNTTAQDSLQLAWNDNALNKEDLDKLTAHVEMLSQRPWKPGSSHSPIKKHEYSSPYKRYS